MTSCVEAYLPSEHDILSSREALSKLAITERHLKAQGPLTIIENFNVIYSCLFHIKTLKQETIDEILSMLMKGLNLLEIDLKKVLAEKLSNDVRVKYLKCLKMLMYLTIEFTNFVEKNQLSSKDGDFMINSKKGAKKPAASSTSKKGADASIVNEGTSNFDWNETKEKILDCIAKIVLLNIQKLWDPPIPEEQFVIMITNLCYKLMENFQNSSARLQQKKVLKDHLCHILGIMIKKYNHSYGACVMIMQTLPHYEHLGSLYADLIQTCVVQLGYESILPDILREFRHTSQSHQPTTTTTQANQNDPNFKFYSQFIIDLSDRLAPHLLPYLSLIQDLLDDDSYMMRNAILHLYGEIIVKVLNQEATDNDLKLKQMRNELLDTLCEHIHDTNAITRSRTLQIWRRICEEKAMPLHYMNEVMKRCIGRMEDVASSVRKSAFQLLCDLIRKNPYGIRSIEMSLEQIEQECAKEEAALQKLKDEDEKLIEQFNKDLENHHNEINSQEEGSTAKDSDMEDVESQSSEDSSKRKAQSDQDLQDQQEKEKRQQLIIVQTSKVNYLKDMLSFVKQLESAIPKISRLLFSKIQTDVLEVISFFVTCYEHGLNDMLIGIRKMLSLVMFAEKSIKDAVINAYKRLYLTHNESSESSLASAVQIAKQLIKLIQDITVCERDALEELIGEFALSGELDNSVIQVLWEIFANFDQNKQHRLNALILLGMVIKRIPEKGRANIQVLIDFGLNTKSTNADTSNENMDVDDPNASKPSIGDIDLMIFSETCLTLSYMSADTNTKKLTQQEVNTKPDAFSKKDKKAKEKEDSNNQKKQPQLQFNNEPFKLINSHQLFERLNVLLVDQFMHTKTNHWIPFAENSLQCIFKLADNPILITESITLKLIEKIPPLKCLLYKQLPPVPLFSEETQSSQPASTQVSDENSYKINSKLFARFFSFIGLLSTKLLIFLNQYVVCELKRRKMCKENQQLSANDSSSKNKSNNSSSTSSKSKRRQSMKLLKSFNQQGDIGLEEEMGLQGAEAEDVELILIESIIDQKIVVSTPGNVSILAQLLPIIVAILKDPAKYNDDTLQLSCALALVKLMVLSQKLCTQYSQLLFTLMEKSPNPLVRSQLILGIGDLVYRFPNAMEPWTNHLYLPLRDKKSKQVRMNTIRVLSHLILKEMIKTRGQLYEIALCTVDSDPQISAMSKQFFQELSLRNNGLVIYNAMPDMISNLSGGANGNEKSLNEQGITEESFRNIVTYLFTFIKRDKQCETLIEKLCHAFRQANKSERKCRDLAFCLSKLQLSENGIKKLKETFKWYADKLCIPYVYETFKQTILKNARKLVNMKNETKLLIDELEKQIEEVKQKGLEKESDNQQEEAEGETNEENNQEAEAKNKKEESSSSEDEEAPIPSNQRAKRGVQVAAPTNAKKQAASHKVDMLSKFNRETKGKKPEPKKAPAAAAPPATKGGTRASSRRKVVVKEESPSEDDSDEDDDEQQHMGRMSNSSSSSSDDSE